MSAAALETVELSRNFGGLIATNRVSLRVEHGARHALIGPNGAGKTTLVNLLSGLLSPSSGTIVLYGEDITRVAPQHRVHRGLVRTFQINQLFQNLTPLESVVAAIAERDGFACRAWAPVHDHRAAVEEAADLLARLKLTKVQNASTGTIGYGKQRLLEIAVTLACRPRLILMDEPAAGLAAEERLDVLAVIDTLPADIAVLLIEHDMDLVFRFANRITVLMSGGILVEGSPQEIATDPRVRAAYLGSESYG